MVVTDLCCCYVIVAVFVLVVVVCCCCYVVVAVFVFVVDVCVLVLCGLHTCSPCDPFGNYCGFFST